MSYAPENMPGIFLGTGKLKHVTSFTICSSITAETNKVKDEGFTAEHSDGGLKRRAKTGAAGEGRRRRGLVPPLCGLHHVDLRPYAP